MMDLTQMIQEIKENGEIEIDKGHITADQFMEYVDEVDDRETLEYTETDQTVVFFFTE